MNMYSYEPRSRQGELDTFNVQGAISSAIDAVLKHKILILVCTLFSVWVVWTYVKLFPPIYKAEVLVQAEPEQDIVREQFYSTWNTFRKSELSSEVELMTSTPVVKLVVEQLNLNYDDVYHTHLKQLVYLWSKSTIGNWYRKVKRWFFPPKESPYTLTDEEIEFSKTVLGFRDGARLEPVPDSHVGYLVVKGPTPRVAEYANLLIDIYSKYRRDVYSKEADTAYQSLLEEVKRAEQERDEIMNSKLRFENENGLAMGLAKDKAVMTNLAELLQKIQDAEFKLHYLEAELQVISGQLAKETPFVLKSDMEGRNPIRDGMRETMFTLQTQLSAARLVFKPDSPEIQDIEKRISDLEASMPGEPKMIGSGIGREQSEHYETLRARKQEIDANIASTKAELQHMNDTRDSLESRVAEIPSLEKESLVFQQDQEMALIKYRNLREKLMQADVSRISAQSAPPSLRAVEHVAPPDKPYWPKTKLLFAVAALLGLIGGIGLAILIETLNNRATHVNLLTRADLPIYAMVEVTHRAGGIRGLLRNPTSRSQRTTLALERLKDIDDVDC